MRTNLVRIIVDDEKIIIKETYIQKVSDYKGVRGSHAVMQNLPVRCELRGCYY